MTTTQISHFLAVADSLSFTQAANMLYVSQPAISKSVSKLEEYLGFKLFERNETALSLTPAGEAMYEFFTQTGTRFNTLVEDIRDSVRRPESAVRLGCPETWDPSFFYGDIESYFAESLPDIKLTIECHKLSELISRLQAGKLDIILTHDFFIPALPNISAEEVVYNNFGILYSKKHFDNVTSLTDFAHTPFLLFDNDIEKRFSNVIRSICSGYGITPKIINYSQLPSALFHTACGNGIMLFSSWDIAVSNPSFGFLNLKESIPVKVIHFTDNPNKSVDKCVDAIRTVLGSNQ